MPTNQPNPAESAANPNGAENTPTEFEALLANQPDEFKAAYEAHVKGLKSALDKERKANRGTTKTQPPAQKPKANGATTDLKKKIEEAARAAKNVGLSDADKIKREAERLKQENARYAEQVRKVNAREALILEAERQKIEFTSERAKRDAIEVALTGAAFDSNGNVIDPSKLLKSSLQDRDYLIKKPTTEPPPRTNARDRGKADESIPDAEKQAEIKRRFRIR